MCDGVCVTVCVVRCVRESGEMCVCEICDCVVRCVRVRCVCKLRCVLVCMVVCVICVLACGCVCEMRCVTERTGVRVCWGISSAGLGYFRKPPVPSSLCK